MEGRWTFPRIVKLSIEPFKYYFPGNFFFILVNEKIIAIRDVKEV